MLEGVEVSIDGWHPRERALRCVEAARRRYREERGDREAEPTDPGPRPAVPG
jgi:hypothetical protein